MAMENYLDRLRRITVRKNAPNAASVEGTPFSLDAIASCNLELEIGDHRGSSTFTLRGVPSFLVDAFYEIRTRGMSMEGIFRKEGNTNRMKNAMPTFFGCKPIPVQCTIHDICCLVKRFFRELQLPLFAHQQARMIEAAKIVDGSERVNSLLEVLRSLPPFHLGTTAYLMRQLNFFGDNHEHHQMTVENLARVFAPTLFRDGNPALSKKKQSQEDVLSFVQTDNNLRITLLVDLIDNAYKIGVPRDYYIASRCPSDRTRSRSHIKPFLYCRQDFSENSRRPRSSLPTDSPVSASSMDTKSRVVKSPSVRYSEKNTARSERQRRSSSTVREIISSISNKVLRRADEKKVACPEQASYEIVCYESDRDNTESDANTNHTNVVDDAKAIDTDSIRNHADSVSGLNRTSRSVVRRGIPHVGSDRNQQASSLRGSEDIPCIDSIAGNLLNQKATNNSLPSTYRTKNSERRLKTGESLDRKRMAENLIKRNSSKRKASTTDDSCEIPERCIGSRIDEKRSSLRRFRRHTAPVKANSLIKRNQPNSINSGLKPIKTLRGRRSNTLSIRPNGEIDVPLRSCISEEIYGAFGREENENQVLIDSSISDAANLLLEEKGAEARRRRAERRNCSKQIRDRDNYQKSCSLLSDLTNAVENPVFSNKNGIALANSAEIPTSSAIKECDPYQCCESKSGHLTADLRYGRSDYLKHRILSGNNSADFVSDCTADYRPSIAYITSNKRGMVQRRISQFAQLSKEAILEQTSPDQASLKPIGPPASHSVYSADKLGGNATGCTRMSGAQGSPSNMRLGKNSSQANFRIYSSITARTISPRSTQKKF